VLDLDRLVVPTPGLRLGARDGFLGLDREPVHPHGPQRNAGLDPGKRAEIRGTTG